MLRLRGKATQLSPAQIQALLFLQYARPGVCTIGGLAKRLSATYATASGVADALENKGLVKRKPLAEDQRIIKLILTSKGIHEVEGLEDVLKDIEVAVESLPQVDQQALLRATQSMVRQLQDAGHVQVYEMCWNCQFFQREAHPNDAQGPHHCAFVDAPLREAYTYLECPDFVSLNS
jgi:DNA-binding MarR family transcriptional regulator